MKPFLLIFNPHEGSRQEILDYLDTRPEVLNWHAFMSASIFIISEKSVHELNTEIRTRFPTRSLFITELPAGLNTGWLTSAAWKFINNPKSSGKWK